MSPVVLAFFCLAAFSFAWSAHIDAIQFASYPDHTLVCLVSDKEIRFRTGKLSNPERFYLDILDVTVAKELKDREIKVKDPFLKSIRVGSQLGSAVRVVFDLRPAIAEKIVVLKNPPGLLVNFEKRAAASKSPDVVNPMAPGNGVDASVTELVPKTH